AATLVSKVTTMFSRKRLCFSGNDFVFDAQPVYIFASSAESVGEFRLGQRAESMVQSDFCTVIGPKAEGFSGRQFCLAVKSLHDAAGELAFGPEPVHQKLSMAT